VGRAIDSVLRQQPAPHEVIVVDDGSTDGTCEVLREYGNQIRLVERENGGPAAARNAGLALATGDWVGFLDSDDEWLAGTLAAHVHALRSARSLAVHIVNALLQRPQTGTVELFAHLNFTPLSRVVQRPLRYQIANSIAWPQCALVRRAALDRVGGFDERFTGLYEDFDLFCRLAFEGAWGIDDRVFVHILRRTGAKGAVSDRRHTDPTNTARAMLRVYSKLAARPDLDTYERRLVADKLARYTTALGMALLRDGRPLEARQAFSRLEYGDQRMGKLLRLGLTYLPRSLVVRLLDTVERGLHEIHGGTHG